MEDAEIQETVEAILGKGAKVIDCEKKSSIKEEEILLINGLPVTLEGRDGIAIKQALITGQVPPCDLLNTLLIKAGILRAPVKLETSLSVKSSLVTKEEITVAKGGKVVDERSRETKENNFYTSSTSEVWEPIKIIPTNQIPDECLMNIDEEKTNNCSSSDQRYYRSDTQSTYTKDKSKYNSVCTDSSGSSYESNDEINSSSPVLVTRNDSSRVLNKNGYLPNSMSRDSGNLSNSNLSANSSTTKVGGRYCGGNTFTPTSVSSLSSLDETDYVSELTGRFRNGCGDLGSGNHQPVRNGSSPTIFGTVASDHTPKDGANRRSLPQTPQTSKSFSALYNGEHVGGSVELLPDSEFTPDNALVYRDGNLISGPLEALVQHMVPTNQYYPDRAYLFAFLLSSRLFVKPHELLAQICSLCDAQQRLTESLHEGATESGRDTTSDTGPKDPPSAQHSNTGSTVDLQQSQQHHNHHGDPSQRPPPQFATYLVQLLAEWTETFPYDFRDERVMQHVRSITQKCVTLNPVLRKDVSSLLQNLLQRLTTLENYEEFLQKISNNSELQDTETISDVTELCANPGILAQQLTHIELERLSYIGPEEFVQAFAKENPNLETSFKDMKKTRNLESYVQWFNRLSYLVATEVVKYPKKKQRVRVVEYWIETARECFNIGNFNSLMAIIAGLNMSPISRLKKTWNKIQSGKFSILEHQMDPSSNFSSYRSTLKAAMWRSAGARDERQRIVIPFFSLLVKDLYFLNEGCSNKLPNGHINFEKFWQLAKQVTEFMAWKQVTCPFERNARVLHLLQTSPVQSENSLALASFECEQPENNQEKERHKTLKQDANNTS